MPRNVEIVVNKTKIKAAKSDVVYWRSQPYIDRLAAVESIRSEFHQWKYHAEPRLQRVHRVIKQA